MLKPKPGPSDEAIQEVVKKTGCRSSAARTYLRENQNDVEKAIQQWKYHQKLTAKSTKKDQLPISGSRNPLFVDKATSPYDFRSIASSDGNKTSRDTSSTAEDRIPSQSPNQDPDKTLWKMFDPTQRSSTPSGSSTDQDGEETGVMNLPNLNSGLRPPPGEENGIFSNQVPTPRTKKQQTSEDSSKWDLKLPVLTPPSTLQPGGEDGMAPFSIFDAVAAVQHGAALKDIKIYITHFQDRDSELVKRQINSEIEGFHAMFFVTATNNDDIVRLFEQAGGNVNATYGSPAFPLLAFAIMRSKFHEHETTSVVATLVSLGADCKVFPKAFYSPIERDLPVEGPSKEEIDNDFDDSKMQWCKPAHVRQTLTETFNITERYHIYRSSKIAKPSLRQKQVAKRHNSMDLFAVPYFLIGQSAATELLTKSFLHYMLRQQKQPLVLVFAGPSGHGKTELARRLGKLLSLDLHVSDCTIVTREAEIFGPRKPYIGADEGSPLNNFLATNNGRKCIVFLDEFEKTTQDIWNALLIPFDNGEYQDRRNLKTIDCKNTIWIIATNALDKGIIGFCENNKEIFDEENRAERADLLEALTSEMKNDFMLVFSPPLTGRISSFVPFLPFSHSETCVGVHKYLLELTNDVRFPVCTTQGPQQRLLGNIRLKIRSDASICELLTKEYDANLGMRSLRTAVTNRVASLLDSEYLAADDSITEGRPVEDYSVFISNGRIKVKRTVHPAGQSQS